MYNKSVTGGPLLLLILHNDDEPLLVVMSLLLWHARCIYIYNWIEWHKDDDDNVGDVVVFDVADPKPKRKRMSSAWVVGAVLEYWGTGTQYSPIQSSKFVRSSKFKRMLGFGDQRETITCSPTRGSSVEKIKFANTYMKDDIWYMRYDIWVWVWWLHGICNICITYTKLVIFVIWPSHHVRQNFVISSQFFIHTHTITHQKCPTTSPLKSNEYVNCYWKWYSLLSSPYRPFCISLWLCCWHVRLYTLPLVRTKRR